MKKSKISSEELDHIKSRHSQFPVEDVFAATPKSLKRSAPLKKTEKSIKRPSM